MTSKSFLYNVVKLRPDGIITYPVFDRRLTGSNVGQVDWNDLSSTTKEKPTNLKDNKVKGKLSHVSAKKLKYAINLLVAQSNWKKVYSRDHDRSFKFKVNFVTLTLSGAQRHSDSFLKRYLLGGFLKECKRKFGLKSYVWKAESQKNGNLHFHITTDIYIDYQELREVWNKIQNRYSYLDSFFSEFNHKNPNSTDVHATKGVKFLANYLVKYMAKSQTDRRLVVGSLWGCSDNLKMTCEIADVDLIDYSELNGLLQNNKITTHSDYFTFTKLHYHEFPTHLKKYFYQFLYKVRVNSDLFIESGLLPQLLPLPTILPISQPISQPVQLTLDL